MTRRETTALYFADDKDVYDLIASSVKRLTEARLLEFLRARGVFFSLADDREEIAGRMSRMTWSWAEIRRLVEITDSAERRERHSLKSVDVQCTSLELGQAIEVVQGVRTQASMGDEMYAVAGVASGKIEILVSYTDMDWSRTRLHQRSRKEVRLELERVEGRLSVRHTANERGSAICADIVKQMSLSRKCDVLDISLSGVQDASRRSKFFWDLISGMNKHELLDVSSIGVNRLPPPDDEEDNDEVAEASDGDGDEEGDDGGGAFAAEAEKMLGEMRKDVAYVRSAALSGTAVLHSPEYAAMVKSGFYISKAVWRVREKTGERNGVELEAEFGEPRQCVDFRYGVRGLFVKRLRGGDEDALRATPRPPSREERERYLRLIELSAIDALRAATDAAIDGGGAV